jgi:hypothetical protein
VGIAGKGEGRKKERKGKEEGRKGDANYEARWEQWGYTKAYY